MTSEQKTSKNFNKETNRRDVDWKKLELGEILSFRNGKSSAKDKGKEDGEYPVYGANGIIARTDAVLEEEPVVIVGRVGAYCGNVQRTESKSWATDNTMIVRAEDADLDFIYYLLTNLNLNKYRTGTSQPLLTQTALKDIETEIPPRREQEKIGRILRHLDEKIQANNEINDILEEMAQAFFRSWFFDFDDYDGETTYDEDFERDIPISWDKQSLDKIANFLNGKAWQDFSSEDDEENDLPVVKIKELRNGITEDSDLVNTSESPGEYILDNGDIVFSWSASLVLDLWSDGDAFLNQHLFKVTSQEYPRWFCYLWIDHHIRIFRHIAEAKKTTMGHIKRTDLEEAEVLIPPEEKIKEMSEEMNPIFQKRVECQVENRRLEELRDTLLPKLMSGEVRVNDIELDELEVDSEV